MNNKKLTQCQVEIKKLRESTGMNRKEFCEYFDIPYRTVTEWERGTRNAPEYVLRLMAYYVRIGQNYNLSKKENAKVPQCPPEKEAAIREALNHFGIL